MIKPDPAYTNDCPQKKLANAPAHQQIRLLYSRWERECVATISGKRRMRVVLGGGSFGGDSDFRVHFGLGDAETVHKLEIHWLSGTKQTLDNVAANQILKIKEMA